MAETYTNQSPYHFAGNNPLGNREINGAIYQSLERQDWERGVNESGVLRGSNDFGNVSDDFWAGTAMGEFLTTHTYMEGTEGSMYVPNSDITHIYNGRNGWYNNGVAEATKYFAKQTRKAAKGKTAVIIVGKAVDDWWGKNPPDGGPGDPPEKKQVTYNDLNFFQKVLFQIWYAMDFYGKKLNENAGKTNSTGEENILAATGFLTNTVLAVQGHLELTRAMSLKPSNSSTPGVINGLSYVNKNKVHIEFAEGSASSFFRTFNPSWDGSMYRVTSGYSTTSFTTADGTVVSLHSTSNSTGMASVKLFTKKGYQLIFRFPKF